MNETKHTPGPWHVDGMSIFAPTDHIAAKDVAVMVNDGNSSIAERGANALLIAAAPELLAACEMLVKGIGEHGGNYTDCLEASRVARAALAKAKGE